MEDTGLVALAGLSLSGYSFEQHPEMVSYVKQVSNIVMFRVYMHAYNPGIPL